MNKEEGRGVLFLKKCGLLGHCLLNELKYIINYRPTIKYYLLLTLVNRIEEENQQIFNPVNPKMCLYFYFISKG